MARLAGKVAFITGGGRVLEGSEDIEKLAATHLLGLGLPIHMADMVVYLASDEAAISTGQIISVDSGATIR